MLKHTEDQMIFAQEMANDFANHRGKDLAEEFFRLSGLLQEKIPFPMGQDLFDDTEIVASQLKFLMDDYGEAFRRYLALAYSMGMMDGFQNIPNNTYKTKVKRPSEQQQPPPAQLLLPGMSDE